MIGFISIYIYIHGIFTYIVVDFDDKCRYIYHKGNFLWHWDKSTGNVGTILRELLGIDVAVVVSTAQNMANISDIKGF